MTRIVRTTYRYKRPPRRKKPVALEVPAVVKAADPAKARTHRAEHRMKRLTCEACRSAFTAARFDARYCSPRCRQRAHRAAAG
jgi:hypothetical protein